MGNCYSDYRYNKKPSNERVLQVFRQSSAGSIWSNFVEQNEEVLVRLLNVQEADFTRKHWKVIIRGRAKVKLNPVNKIISKIWIDVGEFVTIQFDWTNLNDDLKNLLDLMENLKPVRNSTIDEKPSKLPLNFIELPYDAMPV